MNNTVSQKRLLVEIETARDEMHKLSNKMSRTSNEVVEVSTHLDKLLNKYYVISYEKKSN
ncbi:aspartyl-phosphate phosphatase Spo0E family protein [Evansella sp. AB-rgal1]|uniref:aspartyl-phosphate phosphatase Spo0E family protein n=1 Tax=Evansella sp. AB-rgal1 TaxID=3242696 RepID=UPI00359D83AB